MKKEAKEGAQEVKSSTQMTKKSMKIIFQRFEEDFVQALSTLELSE